MRTTVALGAALLAALVLAAPAAADDAYGVPTFDTIDVPAPPARMAAFEYAAQLRWGAVPCGGHVRTSWQHLGTGINAQSVWQAVPGAPASTYTDCLIVYSLDVPWDAAKLCTIVAHEYGHLTGHQHASSGVMTPYYLQPVEGCPVPAKGAGPTLAAAATSKRHRAYRARRATTRATAARARTFHVKR